MRVIIQRVKRASCLVNDEIISSIGVGFLILVGFTHTDGFEEVDRMAKKVANLRIFEDESHKMNKSINEVNGSILSISQFTLYANPYSGNRPSFTEAMIPKIANVLYERFNQTLNEIYHIPTKPGQFGADMQLDISCDGPVTITLEYAEGRQ